MAPRILLLSEHTINQIAAGEVIEDPSSVVKELVENALDAGSSDIHILLLSGGRSLIQITDNGCGMEREDAERCFERYATSKLRDAEDLFALQTMGFRGEALSSIASIAKCTLLTATEANNGMGTCVEIEGGQVRAARSAARSRGTTFEVRDLFYNAPVRRKFQKSPHADVLAIHRMLIQIALAHPEVRFCLVSDQKTLMLCPAVTHLAPLAALKERIQTVLGKEYSQEMRPIEVESEMCNIRGFLSSPAHFKQSRSGQYFLLNGRAVGSNFLALAVRDGYGAALPQGKFPLFVLSMTFPLDAIDVNVHPQKKEVRLRNEAKLRQFVSQEVSRALYKSVLAKEEVPEATFFESPIQPSQADIPPFLSRQAFEYPLDPPVFVCAEETAAWQIEPLFSLSENSAALEQQEQQIPLPLPTLKLPPRLLATLPGYLLLDPHSPHFIHNPMSLWVLDQRAAHRRVLHDQLTENRPSHPRDSQALLRPCIVELSPIELQLFEASKECFEKSAWQIEPFGPSSVAIHAVPHFYVDLSYESLFRLLLDLSQEKEIAHTGPARFACALAKHCLSMQTQLNREEATSLIEGLFACKEPSYCPLGRPTLLSLPLDQISTLFK